MIFEFWFVFRHMKNENGFDHERYGFSMCFLVKSGSCMKFAMWEVEWHPWTFGMWTPLDGAGRGGWRHRTSFITS